MITLGSLLSDLSNEVAALEVLLASLDEAAWLRPTPAQGWDVRDSVAHLAIGDDLAHEAVTTGTARLMDEGVAAVSAGPKEAAAFEARLVAMGREASPADVHEWWRTSAARLAGVLAGLEEGQRVQWGPNTLGARSFVTARLMETWAHGLDCFAAAGTAPTDTDRLIHIAHLSLRSLPWAFMAAGQPAPGPVRLELVAPSGETWTLGLDDAPTTIRGAASDWCRVAVRRDRGDERSRLQATGPDGDAVLEHVQAYL